VRSRSLALALIGAAVALGANAIAAPDPADVRPSDHTVPVPHIAFEEPALPYDFPADPPVDGWWKQKRACPAHTRLSSHTITFEGHRYRVHACLGKTTAARPDTMEPLDGGPSYEAFWLDADNQMSGGYRMVNAKEERVGAALHSEPVGVQTTRALDGSAERIEHMNHEPSGLVAERTGALWGSGYLRDSRRQEIWLVWQASDGAVRARLHYDDGLLDGPQRWWSADGAVIARGSFKASIGTWTIPVGAGRAETHCSYRGFDQVEAWDASGALVLRVCGAGHPQACTPLGPTDPAAQRALGAAPSLCDAPDQPPPPTPP
jgi:hypothetical protein